MSGRVLGAVLAGGRSSRFGSDKAAALLGGRTLLDRAAAGLAPQVDAVLVAGRAHPTLPHAPDLPGPGLGPLGGLLAALGYAAGRGFGAVVTVGCDMPLIPADLVAALAGEGPAVVADCPVVGWWPVPLAPALEAHLAAGGSRAVRRWAALVGAREVGLTAPVSNVNTPADLRRLVGPAA